MVELWKDHWHCILPVANLFVALLVMWLKDKMANTQKPMKKEMSGEERYGKE